MLYESNDREESIKEDVKDLPTWYYTHDSEEEYLSDRKEKEKLAMIKTENTIKYGKHIPIKIDQIPENRRTYTQY